MVTDAMLDKTSFLHEEAELDGILSVFSGTAKNEPLHGVGPDETVFVG